MSRRLGVVRGAAELGHRFELQQGFADDGWTACCSCGWEASEQQSRLKALSAWEDHYDEATEEDGG